MADARASTAALLLTAAFLAAISAATWLEAKPLWAAYNAIGAAVAAAVAVVAHRARVALPPVPTAVCIATALLHYVGGSLGGHFGIEGINGLYAVFPWYDRVTHFLGAAGVAALVFHLARRGVPRAGLAAFLAFTTAVAVGVAVELFEFAAWTFFGTVDQGFYSNTMMDLYDDATGAAFGAAGALALSRVRAEDAAPAAA